MQLTKILPSILGISSAAIGCYSEGREGHFFDSDPYIVDIEQACRFLSGSYAQGDVERLCLVDANGGKWDFELEVIFFLFRPTSEPYCDWLF